MDDTQGESATQVSEIGRYYLRLLRRELLRNASRAEILLMSKL